MNGFQPNDVSTIHWLLDEPEIDSIHSSKSHSSKLQVPKGLTDTQIRMQIQQTEKKARDFQKKKQPRAPRAEVQLGKKLKGGKRLQPDTYLHRYSKVLNTVALQTLAREMHPSIHRDPVTHRTEFAWVQASMSADMLSDALYDFVKARSSHMIVDDLGARMSPGDRAHKLPYSQLVAKCDNVAAWALDVFDPSKIEKRKAASSRGGKNGKRGPTTTVHDLAGMVGKLTYAEIAERLECSEATVGRRVRDLKALS